MTIGRMDEFAAAGGGGGVEGGEYGTRPRLIREPQASQKYVEIRCLVTRVQRTQGSGEGDKVHASWLGFAECKHVIHQNRSGWFNLRVS